MSSVVTLTDDNFDKEVLGAPELTMVDFWATWCAPCRQLTPIIDELADEFKGSVKVGKLNLDDAGATAAKYGIKSIPTILFFKDGKVVQSVVGVHPKDHFLKTIKQHAA